VDIYTQITTLKMLIRWACC